MRKYIAVLCSVLALGLVGCKAPLEQGGAYYPAGQTADKPLLIADNLYKVAFTSLDLLFTFERDNRAALWSLNPGIKRGLDKVRNQAWEINVEWATARSLYKANPTPAGLATLETILAKIQQLIPVAQSILTNQGN
jgi:hypothetical protein